MLYLFQDYPIYGVQFHPEKNNYEWAPKLESIPHSRYINLVIYFRIRLKSAGLDRLLAMLKNHV